mmetsp:Transcript_56814/g.169634  ORF Transcript_56814/g.169634 Transcript_56814/m.169634 type:complete len:325 (-) Transcript_56814:327-1301(-)
MSPEEIAALFAAAREKLHPVVGQPTDAFINSLREVLTPILLEIPYDEANAKHSLIGLIMLREEYIVEYGEAFAVPKQLKAYPTVADDAKAPVRAKLEAEHKAQIADWVTFSTVERELRHFILDTFDETWYMELRNAKHFYTKVKPRDLLEHLQNECLGRHAVDVLQLTDLLRKCHVEAAGINEYINMLEDGQRQSIRIDEDNPITNGTLLNVATGAMLKTKQFPRANEEYEALDRKKKKNGINGRPFVKRPRALSASRQPWRKTDLAVLPWRAAPQPRLRPRGRPRAWHHAQSRLMTPSPWPKSKSASITWLRRIRLRATLSTN